jgi:hypothetical protein
MPKQKADFISMYGITQEMDAWIAKSCGGSSSPLQSLLEDDDWTFVIKMHGFVEAGLNQLLLTRFNNPDLREIVGKLDISAKVGKITFIKAFKLLPDSFCLFVQMLSSVRNKAVHDVKNFDLKLVEYVRTLKAEGLRDWRTGMTCWLMEIATEHDRDMAVKYPKTGIFSGCMAIMARAILFERYPNDKSRLEEATQRFGEVWIYRSGDTPRKAKTSSQQKGRQ